ncbi:MAG TPA: class I SAM-dependent methyltransferase [Aggregatilineales bacterium]|nr:class I SAM-dependent methyltransferase [Aggregatilineales bacterium]
MMTDNSAIIRVDPFAALADVYQLAGMADYGVNLAVRLVDLAFEMNWMGRSVLDVGCGTGDVDCWFSEHGYRVIGLDSSASMLDYANTTASAKNVSVELVKEDIRTYKPESAVEMVLCLGGTLNYLPTLRDLETAFRVVNSALQPGKLFMFDLRSIRGLVEQGSGDRILYNNDRDLLIVTRGAFNYDNLLLTQHYIIVRYDPAAQTWQRAEETHAIRGYPLQAVSGLLTKTGFHVQRIVTPDMQSVRDSVDVNQAVVVATKDG